MGADQSSSSGKAEREKLSKAEVSRLMQQQKALFEQKYAELLQASRAQQASLIDAEQAAREAARKEVEKIMKEKQELLLRQNANLSNNCAAPSNVPTLTSLERKSSPYNLTISPTLMPCSSTSTPPSLYPQLPNASALSRNIVSPSSFASMKSTVTSPSAPCTNHPLAPPSAHTSLNTSLLASSSSSLKNNMPLPPTNTNNLTAFKTAAFNPPTSHDGRNNRNDPTSTPLCAGNPFLPRAPSAPLAPPMARDRSASRLCAGNPFVPRAPSAPLAPPMARDRSASRNCNKVRGKVNMDLNCPTCNTPYGVNIYQCRNGHSSCRNCKMGQRACGICGLPITDMRNITLEAYICERKVQCPNAKDGCNLYIKIADIETHAKECPFGQMLCPLAAIFGQCTWRGKQSEMSSHFDNAHQMHRQGTVDTEMVLMSLTSDSHIVHLVDLGIYSFLFHARVSEGEGKIYMVVQFIGTRQSASKWNYEIHIYNKGQPRRKYQFTDLCHPVNNAVKNIFSNSECATIPLTYANTFINDNGFLKYKFFIKKIVEDDGNLGNKINNPGDHSENNNYKNNQSERDGTNEDLRSNNNFRNNYRGRGRGGNKNRYNSGNTQRCHSASSEENNLSGNNQSQASGDPKNQKIYSNRGRGGSRRKPHPF